MINLYVLGRGACGHYNLWHDEEGNLWCRIVSYDGVPGVPEKLNRADAVSYLANNTGQSCSDVESAVSEALAGPAEHDKRCNDPVLRYMAEHGMIQAFRR